MIYQTIQICIITHEWKLFSHVYKKLANSKVLQQVGDNNFQFLSLPLLLLQSRCWWIIFLIISLESHMEHNNKLYLNKQKTLEQNGFRWFH